MATSIALCGFLAPPRISRATPWCLCPELLSFFSPPPVPQHDAQHPCALQNSVRSAGTAVSPMRMTDMKPVW